VEEWWNFSFPTQHSIRLQVQNTLPRTIVSPSWTIPFSHRRWIPLNPRYLAGGILLDTLPRRSLNQNQRRAEGLRADKRSMARPT
jgi:hypothetical protein